MNDLMTDPCREVRRRSYFGGLFVAAFLAWSQLGAFDRTFGETTALRFRPRAGESFTYQMEVRLSAGTRSAFLPDESVALRISGPLMIHIRDSDGTTIRASLETEGLVFDTLTGDGFSRTVLSTLPRRSLDLVLDETGAVLSVSGLDSLTRDSVLGVPLDRLLRVLFPRLPSVKLSSTGTWTEARDIVYPLPAGEITLRWTENGRRTPLTRGEPFSLTADLDIAVPESLPADSSRPRITGRGKGSSSLLISSGSGFFSSYQLRLRFAGGLALRFQGLRLAAFPFSFEADSSLELISANPTAPEGPS